VRTLRRGREEVTTAPASSRRKLAAPLLLALLTAAADQATKAWVTGRTIDGLAPFRERPIVDGWIDLVRVRNPGMAFSLLSDLDPRWANPLLIFLTLAALCALVAYLWYLPGGTPSRWGLGLVLGGAVGNLIDRVQFKYVIDFIDLHWRSHHWPTFNVADIGITVGVALLVADAIFFDRENDSPRPAADRKR